MTDNENKDKEPVRCAECGVPLEPFEAKRTDAGKFTLLCNDCLRIKLGMR